MHSICLTPRAFFRGKLEKHKSECRSDHIHVIRDSINLALFRSSGEVDCCFLDLGCHMSLMWVAWVLTNALNFRTQDALSSSCRYSMHHVLRLCHTVSHVIFNNLFVHQEA